MHFMVVREEQSEPQVSSLGDWMAPLLGVTGKREGLERSQGAQLFWASPRGLPMICGVAIITT